MVRQECMVLIDLHSNTDNEELLCGLLWSTDVGISVEAMTLY